MAAGRLIHLPPSRRVPEARRPPRDISYSNLSSRTSGIVSTRLFFPPLYVQFDFVHKIRFLEAQLGLISFYESNYTNHKSRYVKSKYDF